MGNYGWFDEWTVIGVKCERASTFTHDAKKRRDSTAQLELGFLLGPTPPFFRRVNGGRAAEHNQQDRLSRIAPRSNDAEPSL